MAGNDEGINAWMTVNFLLGSLGGTGKLNYAHTIKTTKNLLDRLV